MNAFQILEYDLITFENDLNLISIYDYNKTFLPLKFQLEKVLKVKINCLQVASNITERLLKIEKYFIRANNSLFK